MQSIRKSTAHITRHIQRAEGHHCRGFTDSISPLCHPKCRLDPLRGTLAGLSAKAPVSKFCRKFCRGQGSGAVRCQADKSRRKGGYDVNHCPIVFISQHSHEENRLLFMRRRICRQVLTKRLRQCLCALRIMPAVQYK